ncbi:MAG TPA: hypothetical protein VH092_15290 [Urbifossiella sp.]|jgi:hypothetical protein|nr:hypothetical protein [Urbifossiella sp.]
MNANAPLYVSPSGPIQLPDPPFPAAEIIDLLRQTLELQREQVQLLKAQQAAQDGVARCRAFLARWAGEFPDVGPACKQTLPALERAYLALLSDLTAKVKDLGEDLQDDFVMAEFLDRFGIRVNQLGGIINQISPIADAAPAVES